MEKNTSLRSERLILKGQTLSVSTPIVMGILNLTPDSFSDGGKFNNIEKAIAQCESMITDGAKIIDVGGESTRPGAESVSETEELNRVIPVLKELVSAFPKTFFSIDTTKYEVAKQALKVGTHILNDVSGLQNEARFVDLCEEFDAGLIIMHSKGEPKTMQQAPVYNDVIQELKTFFFHQLQLTTNRLLDRIILDPGFGFGKTHEHNVQIAHHLRELTRFGVPVLVGASRKATIGKILGDKPVDERLIGTLAFHYDNLQKGAKILRVHDVKPAFESILVYNAISKQALN